MLTKINLKMNGGKMTKYPLLTNFMCKDLHL